MGVDGEGHAHLSHRNGAPVHGLEPGKGILHFDFPFLREVNLGLVLGVAGHVAREAEACVAYLEAAGVDLGLVLVLAADGAVDFGQVFLDVIDAQVANTYKGSQKLTIATKDGELAGKPEGTYESTLILTVTDNAV